MMKKPRPLKILLFLLMIPVGWQLVHNYQKSRPLIIELKNSGREVLDSVVLTAEREEYSVGVLSPSTQVTIKLIPVQLSHFEINFTDPRHVAKHLVVNRPVTRAGTLFIRFNSEHVVDVEFKN